VPSGGIPAAPRLGQSVQKWDWVRLEYQGCQGGEGGGGWCGRVWPTIGAELWKMLVQGMEMGAEVRRGSNSSE